MFFLPNPSDKRVNRIILLLRSSLTARCQRRRQLQPSTLRLQPSRHFHFNSRVSTRGSLGPSSLDLRQTKAARSRHVAYPKFRRTAATWSSKYCGDKFASGCGLPQIVPASPLRQPRVEAAARPEAASRGYAVVDACNGCSSLSLVSYRLYVTSYKIASSL